MEEQKEEEEVEEKDGSIQSSTPGNHGLSVLKKLKDNAAPPIPSLGLPRSEEPPQTESLCWC